MLGLVFADGAAQVGRSQDAWVGALGHGAAAAAQHSRRTARLLLCPRVLIRAAGDTSRRPSAWHTCRQQHARTLSEAALPQSPLREPQQRLPSPAA